MGPGLCISEDERAFVEALVIHSLHKIELGEFDPDDSGSRIVMTHDQVREIAAARHEGLAWDNRQFERLKSRYIGRPGDRKVRWTPLARPKIDDSLLLSRQPFLAVVAR